MNNRLKQLSAAALIASVGVAALIGTAVADTSTSSVKLLTATFETRQVVQVEVGDFHFKPGQVAPVHTHDAPAVGYVAKGAIIYQVEGERPQVLREGDAFYEPTNKRILRFDNASATEEAIFIDFNLEQQGEPFIVFEEKPKEAIDRRSLPTVDLGNRSVSQVDVHATEIGRGNSASIATSEPTLGLVAQGVVELRVRGKAVERIVAGGSFSLPVAGTEALVVNASSEVPAKVITFRLR